MSVSPTAGPVGEAVTLNSAEGAVTWLGDTWYLLTHDRTGRPCIPPRSVDVGAAAAVIGELVLSRRIEISGGGHLVFGPAVDDPCREHVVQVSVMDFIADWDEPEATVGTWIRVLAPNAVKLIMHRMLVNGLLVQVPVRRLVRTVREHHFAHPGTPQYLDCVKPPIWLANALTTRQELAPDDELLAGLADVTGLLQRLLDGWDNAREGYLRAAELRERLEPEAGQIVTHVDVIVGSAVI